jgi:ATP-binding cassette subfamily B protein
MYHVGGGNMRMLWRQEEDAKPKVTGALLRRVLRYGKPYLGGIITLLVAILVTTGLGLVTPLIFRDLIDRTLPQGDFQRLNLLAGALILIPVIGGVIRVLQRTVNTTIGSGVIYDLRRDTYNHLQRMSLRFYTHNKTGELMSRLNNDVTGAQTAISNTSVEIISNLVTVAATLAVMFAMEWRLTLMGLGVLPLFMLAARLLGRRLRTIAREQMEENARMNALMNETLSISGGLLVKLFGRIRTEVERFSDRALRVRKVSIRQSVIGSQFFVLLGLVGAVGTALVYLAGGHLVIRGVFSIGTIVAFSAYLTQLYGPLQSLTSAPVEFAQSMVSFERVFEVLDLPIEIDDAADAHTLTSVAGRLEFRAISFDYRDPGLQLSEVKRYGRRAEVGGVFSGGRPGAGATDLGSDGRADRTGVGRPPRSQARELALADVSFTAEAGSLVALVGPSGAGKTTVSYLVPRLYDPSAGAILIDDRDLRSVTVESLTQQVGMVTQETYLFHDTVRTNLKYAKLDASDQELRLACEAANIHDFISELPDAYDTVVGERGYRLSGGEKQRLALARVILKDPRILVLDEATSHLDSESERLIQEALARVMAGRTSIVIAHRLSTVLAADQILVMDRGRIVERGRHAELVAQGGIYQRLHQTQFGATAAASAEPGAPEPGR